MAKITHQERKERIVVEQEEKYIIELSREEARDLCNVLAPVNKLFDVYHYLYEKGLRSNG